MTEQFKMPSWEEFATKIAHDFVDCQQRAAAAERAGNRDDAKAFRKIAARYKRLMDKNGITINYGGTSQAPSKKRMARPVCKGNFEVL